MTFERLSIEGCRLITRAIPRDFRGLFSRLSDASELKNAGLNADFVQVSASKNLHRGTLRGMHMQTGTSAEEKLVCCVDGEVYDVCLDLREDSPTYLKYCSAVLSEENGKSMYIPKGCAHGFISLKDHSQLIYFITAPYDPASERGYRWNDPAFSIQWPMEPRLLSEKDSSWPLLRNKMP